MSLQNQILNVRIVLRWEGASHCLLTAGGPSAFATARGSARQWMRARDSGGRAWRCGVFRESSASVRLERTACSLSLSVPPSPPLVPRLRAPIPCRPSISLVVILTHPSSSLASATAAASYCVAPTATSRAATSVCWLEVAAERAVAPVCRVEAERGGWAGVEGATRETVKAVRTTA